MAAEDNNLDGKTSRVESRSFDGDLQKDANDFHVKESQWVHARNAINNSYTGDVGRLGNEPANRLCIRVWQNPNPQNPLNGTGPLVIIGFIHLVDDKWVVYSTDNTNSEIGYFEENICRYTRIVNDRCLGFKTTNLIYGQSRELFDCSWGLYWADGLNPDRYLNIGDIKFAPYAQPWPGVPWVCQNTTPVPACTITGTIVPSCFTCVPTLPLKLNCDRARLEDYFKPICLKVFKGPEGGELLNGSYFAVGAYSVNGQRVTDYSIPSNVQPLFSHNGVGGSLRIEICNMETSTFDEFELVVVSVIAQQAVARRIGRYSTRQKEITLDIINIGENEVIPIATIPVINTIYEKSDAMSKVNDYLIRIAPTSYFQFNYQPLANQISTKWVSVEYPEDYYVKGGNNTGYMRDEVYSFFIRWVYKSGAKSASFHIPGRPKLRDATNTNTNVTPGTNYTQGFELNSSGAPFLAPTTSPDSLETLQGVQGPVPYGPNPGAGPFAVQLWQNWNTASQDNSITPYALCDGGIVIARGNMGYWESTEKYPDNKPELWNASAHFWSCLNPANCTPPTWPYTPGQLQDYDLCGKYIRHHKFPDNDLTPQTTHWRCSTTNTGYTTDNLSAGPDGLSNQSVNHIRIMGVQFENIRPPVDNDGYPIPEIAGYEILRGSRVGNKSVIAKGIINNMVEYNLNIENSTDNVRGLFQNYPYNDLFEDPFLSGQKTKNNSLAPVNNPSDKTPLIGPNNTLFSFHSPETNFSNPYLAASEIKIYQNIDGRANMQFRYADQHPRQVFLKDFAVLLAMIGGIGLALLSTTGKQSTERTRRVNISNMPDTLYECEYDYSYNISISGYTNGTASESENEKCDDEEEHPLAEEGEADAQDVNDDMETDEDDYFEGGLGGVSKNVTEAGIGGVGYSKKDNTLIQAYDRFHESTYDINRRIGIQQTPKYTYDWGMSDYIPTSLYTLPNTFGLLGSGFPQFLYYLTEGAEVVWRAMYAFSTPQRHELQIVSHCLFGGCGRRAFGQRRRIVTNQAYIDNQIHGFTTGYRINNLYRGRFVALSVNTALNPPVVTDRTRTQTTLGDVAGTTADDYERPEIDFQRPGSSYYTSLKVRLRNQYGQIDNIVQIPISCMLNLCPSPSTNTGGRNGILRIPEGYENLRLPPLSQCQSPANRIVHGDFPIAGYNPPTVGADVNAAQSATAMWVSTTGYWEANSTIVGGVPYTIASNTGPGIVVAGAPPSATDLVQFFVAPTPNTQVLGGAIPNGVPFITFNFDVIQFPAIENSDWALEVWLGDPNLPSGNPNRGRLMSTYQHQANTTYPVTVDVTSSFPNAPGGPPLDRILFRVVVPDDYEATQVTADIIPFSNFFIPIPGDVYSQKFNNIWIPSFQNIQNDSLGVITDGDLTQVRTDIIPSYDLFQGNAGYTLNAEIEVWAAGSGPTLNNCNFNTKAENYFELGCISVVTINNLIITARTTPWYVLSDDCGTGVPIVSVMGSAGYGGYNPYTACPACATAISTWNFINSSSGVPPSLIVFGNGNPLILPDLPFDGNQCAQPGYIRMSLRAIDPTTTAGNLGGIVQDPLASSGAFDGWIIDGRSPGSSIPGTNPGDWYRLDCNPSPATAFATVQNIAALFTNGLQVTIDPSLYPAGTKFIFVMETTGCQFNFEDMDITIDTCVEHPAISFTNVCVQYDNPTIDIPGCTDPAAPNFNAAATVDDGCCQEFACVTAGFQNTVTQYQLLGCNDANGNPLNAYVPCTNGCCIPLTQPGGIDIGPVTLAGGLGYCNWPCSSAVSHTGNATYNQNGVIQCPAVYAQRTYPLFGGDIYINRYTEKNSFFYFLDWMYGQPDRTEWDYLKYRMLPWPSFWYNSEAVSLTEIVQTWYNFLTSPLSWFTGGASNLIYPSKFHCLDRPSVQIGLAIKLGYIYLFNSGVRDFPVESEYNVDLRDFGEDVTQRHYQSKGPDSFTDIYSMFKSGVIRAGNYYKYDTSLSIAKMYYEYTPWGTVYPPYYDPEAAEFCWKYEPQKLLYSLPAPEGTVRDNWRIYLTDNQKNFRSNITQVKSIYKSGILILFDSDVPIMFQGTDQLQTDLRTSLVIGNGGLFTQPAQSLMNADDVYQYGSCQNKLSVISTPVGVFWVSLDQGKIFQFSSGIEEISMVNLKWWLSQFLPFKLTEYFPGYQLVDNPVAGIGIQTVYDNTNNLLYFCKRDWKPILNAQGVPLVNYDNQLNQFYVLVGTAPNQTRSYVPLGNLRYFEPASWTISYDTKSKAWISFHDWHPGLTSGNTNHFMTTDNTGTLYKGSAIWMHNDRTDLYVNYYGQSYPFEVEYLVNTIQEVNTLRSIEYQLEVYRYSTNKYDRFHVPDFNFDDAVIYNTEQCSGMLRLTLTPKNNGPLINTYPRLAGGGTSLEILYSKEENKYRINQFWDITKDRGEFDWTVNNNQVYYPPQPVTPAPGVYGGPNPGNYRQQPIWSTQPNGYVKNLNGFNLNYSKNQLQHKRFRHYTTSVFLRRRVSGDKKMLISIANNKLLRSAR